MLQNILVITIILAALLHVLWRWMPIKVKQVSVQKLSYLARHLNLSKTSNWLDKSPPPASGCGGCSSCNNCGSTVEDKAKEPAKKEMRISLKSY